MPFRLQIVDKRRREEALSRLITNAYDTKRHKPSEDSSVVRRVSSGLVRLASLVALCSRCWLVPHTARRNARKSRRRPRSSATSSRSTCAGSQTARARCGAVAPQRLQSAHTHITPLSPAQLTVDQARRVREEILETYKQRILERASIIEDRWVVPVRFF